MGAIQSWPPLHIHDLPPHALTHRGDELCDWAEANLTTIGDSKAAKHGSPFIIHPFQRELLRYLMASEITPNGEEKFLYQQSLLLQGRGSGKTTLMAIMVLHELLVGPPMGNIVVAAKSRDQGKILFKMVFRYAQQNPEWARKLHKNYLTLENINNGSFFEVHSRDADTLDGRSITLYIGDEYWNQPTDELLDSAIKGIQKVHDGRAYLISTAGPRTDARGNDSPLFRKYQHGLEVCAGKATAEHFGFLAWQAPPELDWKDPAAWEIAMPGYGIFVTEQDIRSEIENGGERTKFEAKRLCRFVASEAQAFRAGIFEALSKNTKGVHPDDGAEIVLAVDGSFKRDCTAVVGCTTQDEKPHIFVVHLQARTYHDDEDWEVSYLDLADAIRWACDKWSVRECAFDQKFLGPTMDELGREGLPVVPYPQSWERTIPAWERFRSACYSGSITTSGDADLEEHARNTMVKNVTAGEKIEKDSKHSLRKIDLIAAAMMAHDVADYYSRRGYDSTALQGFAFDME